MFNVLCVKLPFGIGQIGKSFRNEITPGNLFSEQENSNKWNLNSSVNLVKKLNGKIIGKTFASEWLTDLNISEDNMRLRDHDEDELSHYSNATTDIEYKFPFGWGELWALRVVQTLI